MPHPTGIRILSVPPGPEPRWRDVGARPAGGPVGPPIGLWEGRWEPLQSRPDRTAYRVETAQGAVFAKHYTPQGFVRRLRDFGIRRKPQRAFALGRRLAREGVCTPEPLELLARGRGIWREALLVTRWIGPAPHWARHLAAEAPGRAGSPAFREAVLSLARLLGALHRLGLYHGDLAGNLLFGIEDGCWRPFLVDLEELHTRLSRKRRVKNLEELGRELPDLAVLTLRDRWDFLREYAAAAGLGSAEPSSLWREGREAQHRRGRRQARRGAA